MAACGRDKHYYRPGTLTVSADHLAEFLFVCNTTDTRVGMVVEGLEHSLDLFLFLVDLLFKALVLLFGHNNRVDIEDLTSDQVQLVQRKFRLAGVQCDMSFLDESDGYRMPPGAKTNLAEIE